jgi:hypothetical protein
MCISIDQLATIVACQFGGGPGPYPVEPPPTLGPTLSGHLTYPDVPFRSICPDSRQTFLVWEPHFCPDFREALTGIIRGPAWTRRYSVCFRRIPSFRVKLVGNADQPLLLSLHRGTMAIEALKTWNLDHKFID